MPRKQVTSRFRGTDIFSRRIVITVSRSGLAVIAGAILIAGLRVPYSIITIISVICAIVSIITTVEARHQLRNFRFEMQEKEVAALEQFTVPDDMPDLRNLDLDDLDDDATPTILRVPK